MSPASPQLPVERWAELIEEHAAACRLERVPPKLARSLARQLSLLMTWNRRVNLTRIVDPSEAVRRHALESIEGARLLPLDSPALLADLGSGNGYPAIPIALACPHLRVLMVEKVTRKLDFLRALVRELGLRERVELHAAPLASPDELPHETDHVTMRAFPDPARWLRDCASKGSLRSASAWLSHDDARSAAQRLREDFSPASVRVHALRSNESSSLLVFSR